MCIALVVITGALPVMALEPHENPDTASLVFDGVALLQKYSQVLDNVLGTNATAVQQLQEQSTLANIPPELSNTVDNFLSSGHNLAGLIPMLEADLENSKTMLAQYRVDDARQNLIPANNNLNQAYSALLVMESTASDTSRWWQAASARSGTSLRQAHDEVQAKLLGLRQLLDLLDNMYSSLTQTETLITTSGQVLRPTTLTLSIEPETAFVGDKVTFRGVLATGGEPPVGRIVTILLDHSPVSSVLTGNDGVFHGDVALPYRYVPEMTVQALYYPVGNDIGQYLGSSSPVVTVKVLYYDTGLNLEAPHTANPGRTLLLKGSFDYGNNPAAAERSLSVYWDGALAAESAVAANFSLELPVAANISPGKHRLTLYVDPLGRYTPAQSVAEVEVTRIAPVIEVDAPGIVLLPFPQDIRGKVYSSLGPLQNAEVVIALGGWKASTRTLDDGTFQARLDTGLSLTLLGSQDLRVTVTPAEPWYKAETRTIRLLVINPANIAGLLLIVIIPALFGVFRLRRKAVPAANVPAPELVPALVRREILARPDILATAKGDPRTVLLALYQGILRLVQEITAVVLSPCHTLREFSRESAPKLGILGGYFQEFTMMIERLLYSRHRSTEAHTTRARELSRRLMNGVKNEGT